MKPCRKVRHATEQAALVARRRVRERTGKVLRAYLCPRCKAWHLGNTRGTRAKNLDRIFDSLPASDRALRADTMLKNPPPIAHHDETGDNPQP